MKKKTVGASSVTMAQVLLLQDVNPAGNVHGGVIMKFTDTAVAVVASRHAQRNTVSASIDRLDFHHPVFVGEHLFLKASLKMVGKTSMEVGVCVEAENYLTGKKRHTASAYLTCAALNDNDKPKTVSAIKLESDEEQRRNQEALARRSLRLELGRIQDQCQKQGVCT